MKKIFFWVAGTLIGLAIIIFVVAIIFPQTTVFVIAKFQLSLKQTPQAYYIPSHREITQTPIEAIAPSQAYLVENFQTLSLKLPLSWQKIVQKNEKNNFLNLKFENNKSLFITDKEGGKLRDNLLAESDPAKRAAIEKFLLENVPTNYDLYRTALETTPTHTYYPFSCVTATYSLSTPT